MTNNKARKADARALAQTDGISYTSALRQVTASPDTPVTTRPPVFHVWVDYWDGPSWGGGLHTHGVTMTMAGRADDGAADWLTRAQWPGDPTDLDHLFRPVSGPDGGLEFDYDHLDRVLTAAWPGAQVTVEEADTADDNDWDDDAADDEEFPVLARRELRRDCMDDCGADC